MRRKKQHEIWKGETEDLKSRQGGTSVKGEIVSKEMINYFDGLCRSSEGTSILSDESDTAADDSNIAADGVNILSSE